MTEESMLTAIPHRILEDAFKAGIEKSEKERTGTLMHINQATVYSRVNEFFRDKIELMDTKKALQKYPWLECYMWRAVDKNKDEYTTKVADDFSGGYFIRILPNVEVALPLQSCLMITKEDLEQRIHNIIIAEEGSKAHIISSCVQHHTVEKASHLGISEFYMKKNAMLNFTMVHSWSEETLVRPRSAALIEDGARFVSNYLCLRPVKDVQMYPVAFCNGEDSRASLNSILYGQRGSLLDVGSKAVLNGKGSRAEMVSRAVVREGAKVIVRGQIEGNHPECKGHLECKALIMDDKSLMQSIPELIARRAGAEITHEASVGKVSEREIAYLMTRGLPQDQAVSMIIRGFMDVSILGLPKSLDEEISDIVNLAA